MVLPRRGQQSGQRPRPASRRARDGVQPGRGIAAAASRTSSSASAVSCARRRSRSSSPSSAATWTPVAAPPCGGQVPGPPAERTASALPPIPADRAAQPAGAYEGRRPCPRSAPATPRTPSSSTGSTAQTSHSSLRPEDQLAIERGHVRKRRLGPPAWTRKARDQDVPPQQVPAASVEVQDRRITNSAALQATGENHLLTLLHTVTCPACRSNHGRRDYWPRRDPRVWARCLRSFATRANRRDLSASTPQHDSGTPASAVQALGSPGDLCHRRSGVRRTGTRLRSVDSVISQQSGAQLSLGGNNRRGLSIVRGTDGPPVAGDAGGFVCRVVGPLGQDVRGGAFSGTR